MTMRVAIAVVGHAHSLAELQAFVDASSLVAEVQLRSGRYPQLYESGVYYQREARAGAAPGVERFQCPSSLYAIGHGDCDDLAPIRAAELRIQGERTARALVIRSPGVGFHVVVQRGDGRIEDPSARLGMLEP